MTRPPVEKIKAWIAYEDDFTKRWNADGPFDSEGMLRRPTEAYSSNDITAVLDWIDKLEDLIRRAREAEDPDQWVPESLELLP